LSFRWTVIGGGLALVLLCGGLVGYLALRTDHGAAERPPDLTAEAATELSSDLRSGEVEKVSRAVVLPAGTTPPPPTFVSDLHGLHLLTFDTATFQYTGSDTGQVRVTMQTAGEQTSTWLAYLAWESGRWKLSTTVPSPSQTPQPIPSR